MLDIHLKIKAFKYEIFKDIYSISARDKINSIQVYETDFIMDRILNEMDLGEIGDMLLKLFNLYSGQFKTIYSSEYYNGNVIRSLYFKSDPIDVSCDIIAGVIPSRLRKKYFIPSMGSGKYVINPDLYLMPKEDEQGK